MGDASQHPVLLLTRKFEPTIPLEEDAETTTTTAGTAVQHSKLTKSILKLTKKGDKRKRNSEQRTEFAPKVSEFSFKGGVDGSVKVDIRDLSRPLTKGADPSSEKKRPRKNGGESESKEKLVVFEGEKRINKKGALVHKEVRSLKARAPARAPLVKHREEKLLRTVGYSVAVEEAKKWKGVVKRNREAETVAFPLVQPSFNVSSTQELVKRFKPRTPLEMEVAKLLNGSESVLGADRILTVREERALKAMDLDEAKRKRAELQKMRSLQSFAQVRAKRQGKIKSKRYHRRLRKTKEGENAKIYEELQKSHPERFQEMLEKMDKKRVEERMNQRHKNNSKWVKSMMKLGKKDAEARTALNEALETSRKLTEKRRVANDDDSEEEESAAKDVEMTTIAAAMGDAEDDGDPTADIANNPWLSGGKGKKRKKVDADGGDDDDEEKEETISSMYPKLKEIRNQISSDEEDVDDDDDTKEGDDNDEDNDEEDDDEALDVEDVPIVRDEDDDKDALIEKSEAIVSLAEKLPSSSTLLNPAAVEMDPNKILLATPDVVVTSQLPTLASYENDIDDDGDDDRRLTIQEAFADDDVVAEFAAVKEAVVEKETPKAVCTALPGWGDWVGGKLEGVSATRKRKFTVKPTATAMTARKDKDKPRVIINEKYDAKLAAHRVSDMPTRDFNSVAEFEKSIRAPVGRSWNAESAYQKLIVPGVTTKMGTVIDPIDKERTFLRKEEEMDSDEEGEGKKEENPGSKKRKFGKKKPKVSKKTKKS